jgi:lysozyme family protein|nr:MAG TPA: Lysozyme [Caudoviricetes sp.]
MDLNGGMHNMANIEHFIPFLIKWEAGIIKKNNETNESFFQRARKTGWADDPDDSGGQTMVGVTMATYEEFCRKKGYPRPTSERLMNLSYDDWKSVLKMFYWDRWRADEIKSQSIAEIVCDWIWASGIHGIKIPQELVGVMPDGIVGPKTIAAVNSKNPRELFDQIKIARFDFIEDICRKRPANNKFKRGWLNRVNDIKFES